MEKCDFYSEVREEAKEEEELYNYWLETKQK